MTINERYEAIISHFKLENPNPTTELHFNNPFETLVAVILTAQCTDKRVNLVTPALFAAYPTPQDMATATTDELLQYIGSVSYPNSKARHLKAMAAMLVEDFDGQVPGTMEELTRLPGVGRKTANVIMGVVFHKAAIAVDTHVFRVANRTGLANGKTPLEVEKALTRHIAEEDRYNAHHWLLLHGRYVCTSRAPHCDRCDISHLCPKLLDGSKLE